MEARLERGELYKPEENCALSNFIQYFQERTGHKYLTNINTLDNVISIMRHGILSYKCAQKVEHTSLALESVQKIRNTKSVPNGMNLHQYASLYFSPRNPMMYYLIHHPERIVHNKLCVFMITPDVLSIAGTVMTDGNAAGTITRFYTPEEGLQMLDFSEIYATWWIDEDPIIQDEKSRKKCAEVLVPHGIPFEMIRGAIVSNEISKSLLVSYGFDKEIVIHSNTFFL